jgi:hypothetical protein
MAPVVARAVQAHAAPPAVPLAPVPIDRKTLIYL